ncbi:ATPase with role in protein import into the ER [Tulasnella sp. JGI-2019a]|nr:ATPase with role in protein import into the ER [Tulasnella sp. JGI-2019a]
MGGSSHILKVRSLLNNFFCGKVPSAGINPDEVVAWGAALLTTFDREHICGANDLDICHIPIGIETAGGLFTTIIPSYSIIPITKTQAFTAEAFSTAGGDQRVVTIQIYDGVSTLTKDNNRLGQLVLDGVHPTPNGVPEVDVSVEIDPRFSIWVKAVDRGSGKSETIRVFLPNHFTA